ncbi:MAG: hypothetical protein EOP48_09100, partial [Sphingobacteriales bacterium]
KRILPFRLHRMVGPFIFMDHAGPVNLQPPIITSMDVLPVRIRHFVLNAFFQVVATMDYSAKERSEIYTIIQILTPISLLF